MRLNELFDDPPLRIENKMRQAMIDVLTPLIANKVEFVTVDQIIDKMRDYGFGVAIDRALVMDVLDPAEIKPIKKIEGDRIYLNLPDIADREVNQDEEEKDKMRIKDKAAKQAKKELNK